MARQGWENSVIAAWEQRRVGLLARYVMLQLTKRTLMDNFVFLKVEDRAQDMLELAHWESMELYKHLFGQEAP